MENEIVNDNQSEVTAQEIPVKKKKFARGIYGSKDVPIRLLDGLIAGIIVIIVVLITVFAINGGYRVTFDTLGGSKIEYQKIRHSEKVHVPASPTKPGYDFVGWRYGEDQLLTWDFSLDTIGGDLTLYAEWKPAAITVKFDVDGGTYEGKEEIEPKQVSFEEAYGTLPIPQREGYHFGGWEYSGNIITDTTIVTMPGEHVLSAVWQ